MSNQNQGVSLSSFADIPMKRKRGRTCKGVSVGGENIPLAPESGNLKSNKPSVWIGDHASADMLGQMVSGVIEGSFDAGYLLNVKVGETNTHLRGAVFQPGLFAPITGANDVAPHAKMYKRKDIPMPFVYLQGHRHVVSPLSWKSEKPVEQKNEASNRPDQAPHTGLKPGASVASDDQYASIPIPPASNLQINESGLPLGQKAMQEQSLGSELHNDKAVEKHQSLQGFEEFELMKAPSVNVEAAKASEPMAAKFAATLPPIETINPKPQVEHQVLSYDFIPQELIHDDDSMSLDVGNKRTPEISELEPQAMACDTRSNMFSKHALSRQATQLELAQKIMNGGANTSHMDGLSASDDVTTTATAPFSDSMTSLPIMIFGAETIPFEPKSAAEESVLPPIVVPEVNSSLMNAITYSMESDTKDVSRSPHF